MKTTFPDKKCTKCSCIAAEYTNNKVNQRRRNDLPLAPWNSEYVKHPFQHVRTIPSLEDQATEITTQPDGRNGIAGSMCTVMTAKPQMILPVVRLHPWKITKQRKMDDYQFSHLEPCEYIREYRKVCTSAFVGAGPSITACRDAKWYQYQSADSGSLCRYGQQII